MFRNSKPKIHLIICRGMLVFAGFSLLIRSIYEYLFITDTRVDGLIYVTLVGLLAIGTSVAYRYSKVVGVIFHIVVFIMSLPFLAVISDVLYDFSYMLIFAIPIIVFGAALVLLNSPKSRKN